MTENGSEERQMDPGQLARATAALDAWFDPGPGGYRAPGLTWDQRELEQRPRVGLAHPDPPARAPVSRGRRDPSPGVHPQLDITLTARLYEQPHRGSPREALPGDHLLQRRRGQPAPLSQAVVAQPSQNGCDATAVTAGSKSRATRWSRSTHDSNPTRRPIVADQYQPG
jgi:hypothetical protein